MPRPSRLLFAAILAAIIPSSVVAAGRPSPTAWSGFYVGLHAGYGWGDASIGDGGTLAALPPYGAFSCVPALTGSYCDTPFELAPRGWLGGAQLGFNWQSGNLVFGVEGDLGWLDVSDGKTLIRPFDDRDIASVRYGWYSSLTGRLGYAAHHALLYVKGGLAFADIRTRAADIDLVGGSFQIYQGSLIQQSEIHAGWALGSGIEFAIGPQLSLKAEYLYMNFESGTARSLDGDIYKFENDLHTVKVGLNYRFSPNRVLPLK